jgi:hypothetical protein
MAPASLAPLDARSSASGSDSGAGHGHFAALFGVGAVALGLLLIGIHNARDAIFYHVAIRRADAEG